MDVDFYNILSVIRGKFWGLDDAQIQDLIIVQCPVAKDLLTRMISASTIKDAFNELSNTKYKNLIPQAENELDAIAEFERAFELSDLSSINKLISQRCSV